jgi:two-component system LytT family response regulator
VAFVQSSEIDWIEAVGDYAGLHVGKKMHLLREPLHLLECRLDRAEFLRIHRSTIVKLDRITRIEPLANRDCRLTLQDGTHLRVSRTYSKPLHDLLRNRESATISL